MLKGAKATLTARAHFFAGQVDKTNKRSEPEKTKKPAARDDSDDDSDDSSEEQVRMGLSVTANLLVNKTHTWVFWPGCKKAGEAIEQKPFR